MLKTFLSTSLFLMSISAYAQEYSPFNLGISLGINKAYADVIKKKQGLTNTLSFDYNFNPYLSLGLEGQFGKIRGGDQYTEEHKREFVNQYKSLTAILKVELGTLTRASDNETVMALNRIYFGAGVGLISNKMVKITRVKPDGSGWIFPGEDKSINLAVPVLLGINIPIQTYDDYSRFTINFNVQGNVTFGEGLDGYNDNIAVFENKSSDFYTVFSLGLRYAIGAKRYYN